MRSPIPLEEQLCQIPLFATADKQHLLALAQRATSVSFPAGAAIAESEGHRLGIVQSGRAEICSTDPQRSVVLRTLFAHDVFGAAALFCRNEDTLSRIRAACDCTCVFFEADAIRELLHTDNGFLDRYLSFLAGRVQFLNKKILCFTAGSAERRLALWLLSEEHDVILLPTTLTVLSDMLDIGRASLYRALDKLSAQGWITRKGREIRIQDYAALRDAYR